MRGSSVVPGFPIMYSTPAACRISKKACRPAIRGMAYLLHVKAMLALAQDSVDDSLLPVNPCLWGIHSGSLQPRGRGPNPEGLLRDGLQVCVGGVDVLLGLLQGLGQLQDRAPLALCGALLFARGGSELAQQVAPLRLRLAHTVTYCPEASLPVGRVVPLCIEASGTLCGRRPLGLQLPLCLLQRC